MLKALTAIGGETKYLRDVQFKEDVSSALDAPVTEFATITLKEGANAAIVEDKLAKLITVAKGWGRARGNYGGSWGPVVDEDGKYFFTLGWESFEVWVLCLPSKGRTDAVMQVFKQTVYSSPEAIDIIVGIKELADVEVQHASLSKH